MTSTEGTSKLWEQLVTDGHVRAARVRWIRPWLIATAIILILAGIELLMKVKPERELVSGNAIMADIDHVQGLARSAVDQLPPVNPSEVNPATLASSAELPKLIEIVMSGLNTDGSLPKSKLPLTLVEPSVFWARAWSSKSLYAVDSADVKLVAGIFNTAPKNNGYYRYQPVPQRWIGVFRKKENTWQYASLAGASLIDVPGHPSVVAEMIPLTLRSVLPGSAAR